LLAGEPCAPVILLCVSLGDSVSPAPAMLFVGRPTQNQRLVSAFRRWLAADFRRSSPCD
jgi:hypothetical protein